MKQLLVALLLISACAAQDKATVTVYHPNGGYLGNRFGVKIYSDKKHVATVAPKRFTTFELEPGTHELSVTPGHEAKTKVTFEAGKAYYFSLSMPAVIFAKPHLRQMVPEQGKLDISDLKEQEK